VQIFLQNKTTRRLLHELDRWTPLRDQARDFCTFEKAVIVAHENRLMDIRIVMVFVTTGQTFLLPLPETDEIKTDGETSSLP
jgi:hypothetical protein